MVRWPGHVKPGQVANGMVSGLDWFPTLLAAAGDTDVKDRLLSGWKPDGSAPASRNHLDGYNQLDYITGKSDKSARTDFYYFDDDGDLVATRYDDWKVVFKEQPAPGGFACGRPADGSGVFPSCSTCAWIPTNGPTCLRPVQRLAGPKRLPPRQGPVEGSAAFLETFVKYPPSQRVASFNIEGVRAQVDKAIDQSFKERGIEK
jgi:hypothetical protein